MSESIEIKFWGVRGSTPCPNIKNIKYGGNTTCFQISSSVIPELLIVDCGTGFRNLGNQLGENQDLKGRIFITHPHWDHLQGFPFFKPFYIPGNGFRVYLPPQGEVGCKEILQGYMSNTFFPVAIGMFDADMDWETFYPCKINFEGYSVRCKWAKHTVQTAMFKFQILDKVIIFAPDNELPINDSEESKQIIAEFKEFVRDADVLIHDAQFNLDQHKERQGWGHSCWENVIDITKSLGIKKLFLTHHDPDSSDEYLSELETRIKKEHGDAFEELGFAKEGNSVSLLIN